MQKIATLSRATVIACRTAMARLIEYMHQQAEACRAVAASESDVKMKADLLVMAAGWEACADRHEQSLGYGTGRALNNYRPDWLVMLCAAARSD